MIKFYTHYPNQPRPLAVFGVFLNYDDFVKQRTLPVPKFIQEEEKKSIDSLLKIGRTI